MSASNYLENKLLNHVLGGEVYTPPTNVYAALHTADPTETGAVGEVSGGSYARVQMTNDTTVWPTTTTSSKANAGPFNFPTPTADWGDVVRWTIWDAPVGGNCLYISNAFTAQPIRTGNPVSIANGALVVTAD